jgi:ABC-type transporter Mla subunit MlaD
VYETLTEIIPGQEASGLSDLQSAAERIGKQVSSVLEDDLKPALGEIKEAMTKVNKDALSKETIDKFKNAMTKLDTTLTRVDEKLLNEENSKNLKEAIAELKDASTSFKNASKSIEDSSKKLSPLIDKLNAPIEKVDKVMTTADDAMKSIKTAADSFSVAAKNITNGKGLLGALINDAQMKADFHDLIYNAKVNGFVWYKNTADKERAKEEPAPAPQLQPAKRKSLFGN